MIKVNTKYSSLVVPILMWLPLALFLAFQLMVRSSAGTMNSVLMQHFSITAEEFGIMGLFYYFGYAGMQIPIGLLLDKYGPRYIATFFMLLCVIGVVMFAFAVDWNMAILARFLIGVGSSGAFISASKVARIWFNEKLFSIVVGFTFTIGLFGAVNGTKTVNALLNSDMWKNYELFQYTAAWQNVMMVFAFAGLLLAGWIFFFVRNPSGFQDADEEKEDLNTVMSSLMAVLKNKKVWIMALLGGFMVGALEGFGSNWGSRFFQQVYGYNSDLACESVGWLFWGLVVGAPILAYITEVSGNHKAMVALSALGMTLCLGSVVYFHIPEPWMVKSLVFITGVFCCYQVLIFALVVVEVSKGQSATAVGFTQSMNMFSAGVFPWLIGKMLDISWLSHGRVVENVRYYTREDFQFAFSSVLVLSFIGFVGFILLDMFYKKKKES